MSRPHSHADKTAIPAEWLEELQRKADLNASFDALAGIEHFHAETMRGRIRCLQLQHEEAWDHFDRATVLVEEYPETIPNLVRQFLLEIFRFENAVIEEPITPGLDVPSFSVPPIPGQILEDFPEVAYVISLRIMAEALLRLHLGESQKALELYEKVIADDPRARPAKLVVSYLGIAAAMNNLGHAPEEVERYLENASFAAQAVDRTLDRGLVATRMYSTYRFLGRDEEAEGWQDYLQRLDCPEETKDAFARRAEILAERCNSNGLLLFV